MKLGCYFCLLMCLIKDHGFEPKPEKAEKFYRFEVDHWTHITKAADRKRPQEGGFLGCFEKPPVSYFPAQKLTWKLKNDPLRKGSSFTHYPFFGFRFSCRRCIWGRNTCILWKTFWVSFGGRCFTFASILSNTVDGPHFAVEKGLHMVIINFLVQ